MKYAAHVPMIKLKATGAVSHEWVNGLTELDKDLSSMRRTDCLIESLPPHRRQLIWSIQLSTESLAVSCSNGIHIFLFCFFPSKINSATSCNNLFLTPD